MSGNYWGRYRDQEPNTHFDPLQSFVEDGIPYGFRVNFLPGRSNRPREQRIDAENNYYDDEITLEEIENSPLWRVLHGEEPCVPIAGDEVILGDPDGTEVTEDFSEYQGLSIMNKFAPLGINSDQASGVALVNFPNEYTRTLNDPEINYNILRPMKTALHHILEGNTYRSDLMTPLIFFNVGSSSGASLRYLHGQAYAVPHASGLTTYGFQKSFRSTPNCLACKISAGGKFTDHLGQSIDYDGLTVWEDDRIKIIYPYAPIRSMATRIILKDHVNYLGNADNKTLKSIGKGLAIADYLMNAATPEGRSVRRDRTIPFRQASVYNEDFHMFIDLLPPFPFVAAETVDFLGMTPFKPKHVAELMRGIDVSHIV